jgi:hypothetical protein
MRGRLEVRQAISELSPPYFISNFLGPPGQSHFGEGALMPAIERRRTWRTPSNPPCPSFAKGGNLLNPLCMHPQGDCFGAPANNVPDTIGKGGLGGFETVVALADVQILPCPPFLKELMALAARFTKCDCPARAAYRRPFAVLFGLSALAFSFTINLEMELQSLPLCVSL